MYSKAKYRIFMVFWRWWFEFLLWMQALDLCAGGMLWWRLHLIHTIWKPQLLFSYTGDYSPQSHGCYKPIVSSCCTVCCPAQCAVSMLDLCCNGGILHCVPGLFRGRQQETESVCICTTINTYFSNEFENVCQ